jgi:hypothetical protein
MELEDEAERARAEARELGAVEGEEVPAADPTSPASGRSRLPMQCRSVLLPAPEAPSSAVTSPVATAGRALEHGDGARRAAAGSLDDAAGSEHTGGGSPSVDQEVRPAHAFLSDSTGERRDAHHAG